MMAYFARRVVGGVFAFLASTLVIFTIIIYAPNGPNDWRNQWCMDCDQGRYKEFYQRIDGFYHTDQPWPMSYLTWLFDPAGPKPLFWGALFPWRDEAKMVGRIPRTAVNIEIGSLRIHGSGILTGDLSVSVVVDEGQWVTDMFGEGLGEFLLLLALILPISMTVVVVQRGGRPPLYGPSNYPKSRCLVDGCLRPMRVLGV